MWLTAIAGNSSAKACKLESAGGPGMLRENRPGAMPRPRPRGKPKDYRKSCISWNSAARPTPSVVAPSWRSGEMATYMSYDRRYQAPHADQAGKTASPVVDAPPRRHAQSGRRRDGRLGGARGDQLWRLGTRRL